MTDQIKASPKITISAGDATYELSNTLNSWCDLEDAFDLGVNGIIQKFGDTDTLRVGDVRKYLSVVLRDTSGAPLTTEASKVLCDIIGITECTDAVTKHILATFTALKGS